MFTPENAASVLTAHDEIHDLYGASVDAWPSVAEVNELPVVEITLTPVLETSTGTSPDRDNEEHFHAWVLPGRHNPGRYVIDQGRITCDPCGEWLVRLDDGKPLDDLLAAVSAHECTAVEAAE